MCYKNQPNMKEPFVTANRLYDCAYHHCFEEGFFTKLFKKKLKPLDWDAINYVLIKNNDVYRNSDKLLLASYASSKLSDAKYYLEILQKIQNPNVILFHIR